MQNPSVLKEFNSLGSCSINEPNQGEGPSREASASQATTLEASDTRSLTPLIEAKPETETVATLSKPRYPGAFSSDRPTPFEQSNASSKALPPSGLHNARDPYYPIQHEKGIHRLVAMMHVRGDTNREIAQELERSEVNISNILRQPYVQQYIVDEVKRLGGEQVQLVLKGAALKAAQRLLAEIDNTSTGSSQSRISAANSTLDRVFGKAPQSITHYDGGDVDQLTDAEIAQRLNDLKKQKAN